MNIKSAYLEALKFKEGRSGSLIAVILRLRRSAKSSERFVVRTGGDPTDPLTTLELQDPSHDFSEHRKFSRSLEISGTNFFLIELVGGMLKVFWVNWPVIDLQKLNLAERTIEIDWILISHFSIV